MRMTRIRTAAAAGAATLLFSLLVAAAAVAQQPGFSPILTGHRVVAGLAVDGRIYAGLAKGGVVEWDAVDETALRSLDRGSGLSGHYVQDIGWSGSRLLIAFGDGGITAISNPGTSDEFMQLYRDGLASLDVTCVTGQQIGGSERIYYGTAADGIGVIDGGREGAYFSTLDGLIADEIVDVVLSGDLLLVATPIGLSRFASNVFTNYRYDETGMAEVNALATTADGAIWAATADGVKRWDDAARDWIDVLGPDNRYNALAVAGTELFGLRNDGGVARVEGDGGYTIAVPDAPAGYRIRTASVIAVDGEPWVGGSLRLEAHVPGSQVATPWLAAAGDDAATIHTFPTCRIGVDGGFDGVAVDVHGRAWVGDRQGDGLAGWNGSSWYNVDARASAENDSSGFYDYGGGVLAMTRAGEDLWFNQYAKGAIRFRPPAEPGGEEQWQHVWRENSPMQVDGIINVVSHPDGAIFFCSDNANWWGGGDNAQLGVDVLFDPERPYDPASWLHVGVSELGGNFILTAGFERRDVVWFSVQGVGLRRWDINGLGRGPDDPLTWSDTTDDYWTDDALVTVPGGSVSLTAVRAITVDAEGDIWAGGSGLVRFAYDPSLELATLRGEWVEKVDTFAPGLLGQVVGGLALDRNDDLWILTENGLDRFRIDGDEVEVDSYTDLVTFGSLDQRFYSASAIAPLPGGTYRGLASDSEGRRLALTSDLGAVMVDVPRRSDVGGDAVETAFLYPNPFPGDDGAASLSLGGLVIDEDTPARLEILNLLGQIVHRNSRLTTASSIWDGRNRLGERVASGLYVVRIEQGGAVSTRTLAIAY